MTIYGDTLTVPKPVYGIDSKKESLTLDGFEIERPSFEMKEEEVENIPMDFTPYGSNNVVAMSIETRNIDNNVSPFNMNRPKTIHQEPKRIHTQ